MEINFFWIVSQIILSIIIISIIHYIYVFFKDNLTVPKIKDLVKKPKQQYTNIYESLKEAKKEVSVNDNTQSIIHIFNHNYIVDGKKFLEKSIHVELNSDFFKLCVDDNKEHFSEYHFTDSLKTMNDKIDEKTIGMLDLDTERLFNYNQNEPRIGLTWNHNYSDFKI